MREVKPALLSNYTGTDCAQTCMLIITLAHSDYENIIEKQCVILSLSAIERTSAAQIMQKNDFN
jgi:hypothetical protein